jgi:hypothetical protein
MLAKSPHIIIDLPANITSWVQPAVFDIRVLGTIREPFTAVAPHWSVDRNTALQAECQADRDTAVANQELRAGQRTT